MDRVRLVFNGLRVVFFLAFFLFIYLEMKFPSVEFLGIPLVWWGIGSLVSSILVRGAWKVVEWFRRRDE